MRGRNIALVVLWSAGALLSFSAIALSVRLLARDMGLFDILFIRNVTSLSILLAAAALYAPFRHQFRPVRPGLHLLRNTFHFAAQYSWSYAVVVLPLATAFALEFTAPIWLAILAILFLGERLTVSRGGAIVLGLIGVLVILRPGQAVFQPSALVMLAAAFGFAAVAASSKALTRTLPTFTILLWMNLIQIALNLFTISPSSWTRIGTEQLPGIAMLAIGGISSHLCQLQAYRYGDAIVVMPLDFLRIPLIALIGWSFYGEALDPIVFLGALVIVSGILWNLLAEARRQPRPA